MQLTLGDSRRYENRALFANHFLEHRLESLPAWQDLSGLVAAFKEVKRLFHERAAGFGDNTNESQTEHEFIRPVLDLLWHDGEPGDCYQVQAALPSRGASTRVPDYALFRSAAERQDAAELHGSLDYWSRVACVGDAKRWNASLDIQRRDESPAAQLTNYLYRAKVRWGILTNGRYWRLYELEQSRGGGVYYEVDLAHSVLHDDAADFQYFLHFFRRAAFVPDASGHAFLDKVLDGSVTYAAEVTERLKDSVYDALRLVINGFLDRPENQLDRSDDATLRRVHDNALIVLYRLLFILYAEDRELLPRRSPAYQNYSLERLQQDINETLKQFRPYLPIANHLWSRLLGLFQLIDVGYQPAGIPAYNGGLFSPANHPHLAYRPVDGVRRWEIGDDAIAQAIDLLAYERQPGASYGVQDIDYATMAVQHLGSIYEGLLELQPRRAETTLVEVIRGKSAAFRPLAEVDAPAPQARRIEPGEIYLATDRGERHATGSYYTPGYIVDYIVEQTIEPLVAEAAERVRELRPAVDQRVAELTATQARLAASDLDTQRREAEGLTVQIEAERARLLEPYLSLRLLDPTMGSGHFLVGAADFLSLQMAGDEQLLPLDAMSHEDPQIFYKRRIVERCLYGVDLNPLAVELAKLSLWLHTVSGDRALSFLGHHLRCGNSLVGARLRQDLETTPVDGPTVLDTLCAKQLGTLLGTFRKIAEAPAGEAESERAKAHWYDEMDRAREPFRQVANAWLARYFGEPVSEEEYRQAVVELRSGAPSPALPASGEGVSAASAAAGPVPPFAGGLQGGLATAQHLAAARRFFHWELEFPEAFLCPAGLLPEAERGFDAVFGNPPYVRQEQLGDQKPYFEARYPAVYHGMADLFVYFFGRGLELLKPGRRLSYISSNSWLQTNFAEPLRRHVRTGFTVETLLDLGDNRVFTEAPGVWPAIFVIRRNEPAPAQRFSTVVFAKGETPRLDAATLAQKSLAVSQADQPDAGWQLTDDATRRLVAKLMDAGRPLGEVVGGRMYRGVLTGLNDAFIIDQATRDRLVAESAGAAEILKPLVRGEDLRPWYQEEEGRWLVRVPAGWTRSAAAGGRGWPCACPGEASADMSAGQAQGQPLPEAAAWDIFRDQYPSVAGWLEPFAERARKRQDKGDYWWELRPCVYYDAFEAPKIIWPDISKIPRFSWDETGLYGNNTSYIAPSDCAGTVGFLNSRAGWLLIGATCLHNKFRGGLWEYRLFSQFMANVPVPLAILDDASPWDAIAQAVTADARGRYRLGASTRHRLQTDLGTSEGQLNQKLTAWWTLDWAGLRAELKRCFKRDIPVGERDEWEAWFAAQRAEHERLTARIVDLETELNDRVCHLYGLTRDEIAIVERVTKYAYGEV